MTERRFERPRALALALLAEVGKVFAAPMIGGMISSTLLTLILIPAAYALVRERELLRTVAEEKQLVDQSLTGEAI